MLALLFASCTSLPTAHDVGGPLPAEWIRVTSADGHWHASFPTWPEIHDRPHRVTFEEEPEEQVLLRWVQATASWGTYAVASAPQTAAVLEASGAARIAEGAARQAADQLEGLLGPTVPWEGVEGGIRGPVTREGGRFSAVAAGVVDGVLILGQASSSEAASIEAFLDGLVPETSPAAVDVALGEGLRARCPATCGPLEEASTLSGVAVTLTGFRGVFDHDRFEAVVAPLRPGVDALAAQEELRARFVTRVGGSLTDVRPEPFAAAAGVLARYAAGLSMGEVRTAVVGNEVVAVEVWGGLGGLPPWSEAFFSSVAER